MKKIVVTFYRFLWRYRVSFVFFFVTLVIGAILENLGPYFYKLFVDAIPGRNYQFLMRTLLVYGGIRLINNWINTFSWYAGDRCAIPASRDARVKVFRQIQDLDFAFHVNKNTGSLISAFKRGDSAFFGFFHDIHQSIFRIAISLLMMLFLLRGISLTIVGLIAVIFALNAVVSWKLIKVNMKRRAQFNEAEDNVSGVITDNLINYETVKFFAQEEREEKRLLNEFVDWTKKIWGYSWSFRMMDVTVGTLSNVGIFFVYLIAVQKALAGQISAGDFAMVMSFSMTFYGRFFELLYNLRNIAKNYVDLQNYFAVLDNETVVKDPERPRWLRNIRGEIAFESVSFNYPGNRKGVLRSVSLRIEPGESVAFVGRSGAGKTTLVKLLLRFYDVNRGKILLDGVDIAHLNKSHLRSFIGVVPQEPILFNNTVAFNIAYGNHRASHQDIVKAAKMANLASFIEQLPEKYETKVGERGIKLSGGQKQRLAIARMILSRPKIIIFDEATSNLDSESEKLIQKALWKLARNKTVLIIAHRFSTVRRADRIIVLSKGKIAEEGTHRQLIEKEGGLYRYLWGLQVKGEDEIIDR